MMARAWTHRTAMILLGLVLLLPALAAAAPAASDELRTVTPLMQGWKFVQDDELDADEALSSDGEDWQTVSLPHTWNAKDAAGLNITEPYKRGLGWYRLEFDLPEQGGARHWLEFGAASIVADVWLNGENLGSHEGAFTAFRFDITTIARQQGNVLLVRADNSAPEKEDDRTTIIPLAGDFNMSGGLYRHVALISTNSPVHVSLDDLGGPGVYAATTSLSQDEATVSVRTRLTSQAREAGEYAVRAALLDADGNTVGESRQPVRLEGEGGEGEVAQEIVVAKPRLWRGREDPYLHRLVVDVLGPDGQVLDRVVDEFGIRHMRFDPQKGFFLNGKPLRLNGVAIHQDYLNKGWAMTRADMEESMVLVREIGANAVRLGHYPFDPYVLRLADRMGMVVWSEAPYGVTSTTEMLPLSLQVSPCPTYQPSERLVENAKEQTREMIRQHFNRASVATWSVGNEITYMQRGCEGRPYDNVTPLLRELHAVAKEEDPGRVTSHADFTEQAEESDEFLRTGDITDIWATNRYYLWYMTDPLSEFGELLDAFRERYPGQALGVSEYGAGAALTHHTDNPLGGLPENGNTGQPVAFQPEGYASYVHEQVYRLMSERPYLWGTFVWNMFDFGSGVRNEGDVRGVNTKGLVSFDRKTRKDPFFFYKANWSEEPVTYIAGRRYTERAYPVADVKVYSNADTVRLTVNGKTVGEMKREQCPFATCVFEDVRLNKGGNRVEAVGSHGGKSVTDAVEWSLPSLDVNIVAGQLMSGLESADGVRFGSDNFFVGGTPDWLIERDVSHVTDKTPVRGTPDPLLFERVRRGEFSYEIPLPDGRYRVRLGFTEPDRLTRVGERVFDVLANGEMALDDFDVLQETGGQYRQAVTRELELTVSGGRLKLDFVPSEGEAVISNIMIRRR